MFKFAWRKSQSLEDTDTTFSSESDSDDNSDSYIPMQNETNVSEDSVDVWPDL